MPLSVGTAAGAGVASGVGLSAIAATALGSASVNGVGAQIVVSTGTSSGSALCQGGPNLWLIFVPPYDPSPGTSDKPEIKIKTAEFGDGYTQETRNGLNHIRKVVSLTWEALTQAQADTIESFFTTQGGDLSFYYSLRGDIQRKWTCKDWTRVRGSPNTINATIRESFTPIA